jgi:hypothetical protein
MVTLCTVSAILVSSRYPVPVSAIPDRVAKSSETGPMADAVTPVGLGGPGDR